ncbi:MAG: DUF393 domain-containing protein [Burkholderiaceae bacterium]|nr:DUF393 domain-containing protein [Burkholderiaceae bacterium]
MTDRCAPAAHGDTLTVLYDGACPLCRREIAHYRGLAGQVDQPTALAFTDVSAPGAPLPAGQHRDDLLARFHVQHADGRVLSGAAAFVALWARLPGWRWLAAVARVPGVTALMELAYRAFLPLRPTLQRWARRTANEPASGDRP